MSEPKDPSTALKVRLTPSDASAHPRVVNYTTVGVAQGMAYLDCGFVEPTLLAAVAKSAKDGAAASKRLDGHLVARVAMDVNALAHLYRQIQQVLVGIQAARKPQAKGSE
ncbi:MAG: hypothetical protein HP496_17615 [Nitrospira sp.]|nr:hypothetical protein [Nitrospira sp.]